MYKTTKRKETIGEGDEVNDDNDEDDDEEIAVDD